MIFEERRKHHSLVVLRHAKANNIEFRLLDAIIATESSYNQWATRYEVNFKVSDDVVVYARKNNITRTTEVELEKFSWGLGQIMGGTARWLGFIGPLPLLCVPDQNLLVMVKLIKKLQKRYTQEEEIIAAYNAGSARKLEDGSFRNQDYVDKVYKNMGLYVVQNNNY